METLPKDVFFIILSKIEDEDIIELSLTNKYFYNLCNSDLFWKNKTIDNFPHYENSGSSIWNWNRVLNNKKWKSTYFKFITSELYQKLSLFSKLAKNNILLNVNSESLNRSSLGDLNSIFPLNKTNSLKFLNSAISHCEIILSLEKSYVNECYFSGCKAISLVGIFRANINICAKQISVSEANLIEAISLNKMSHHNTIEKILISKHCLEYDCVNHYCEHCSENYCSKHFNYEEKKCYDCLE